MKGAERGRWTQAEAEAASARLRAAPRLEDLAGCELVIEAAPEDLELKRELFAQLAGVCGTEAILATNTSSLSVTAIAAGVERPERVCGMHFFNPPALMRLVEVVAGDETSEETLAIAGEVARAMGRQPIRAADAIGFVANRCARPFTLEALRLLGDRIATHDQIDRIVRIGGGFRMGPFELMDLVGVDVNFEVAKSFWEQSFHEPRWRPHPIQSRMVAAGRLGRKAGRGYYDYRDGAYRPDDPAPPDRDPGWTRNSEVEDSVRFAALPSLEEATLVELARRPATTPADAEAAETYFRSMGKHVEWVDDAPGLVLGRISGPDRQRGPLRGRRGGGHRRRTSTSRCGSASTSRGGRSSGPRRSAPRAWSASWTRCGRSWARSAIGRRRRFGAPPAHRRRTLDRQPRAGQDQRQAGNRGRGDPLVEQQRSVDDRETGRQVGDDERARRPDPSDQGVEDREREPGSDDAQRRDGGERAQSRGRSPAP